MDADRIGRIRKLKVEFDELRAIAERERERKRALNEYYTGIGRLPEEVDDEGAETGLPSLESMRSFDPSSSTSRGPAWVMCYGEESRDREKDIVFCWVLLYTLEGPLRLDYALTDDIRTHQDTWHMLAECQGFNIAPGPPEVSNRWDVTVAEWEGYVKS